MCLARISFVLDPAVAIGGWLWCFGPGHSTAVLKEIPEMKHNGKYERSNKTDTGKPMPIVKYEIP